MDIFFDLNKFRSSIKQEVINRPRSQMRYSQLKRKMSSCRNSIHGSTHTSIGRIEECQLPKVLNMQQIKQLQQIIGDCDYINDLSVYYVQELVRFASLIMERVVQVRGHK